MALSSAPAIRGRSGCCWRQALRFLPQRRSSNQGRRMFTFVFAQAYLAEFKPVYIERFIKCFLRNKTTRVFTFCIHPTISCWWFCYLNKLPTICPNKYFTTKILTYLTIVCYVRLCWGYYITYYCLRNLKNSEFRNWPGPTDFSIIDYGYSFSQKANNVFARDHSVVPS